MGRRLLVRRPTVVVLIAITLSTACGTPTPPPTAFPAGTPKLVLFLVIDQLSQDYLVRFRPLLDGGFGYLLDNGVVFADAHHDHANTVTGAGHATLASGCFPRRSGIISNRWFDRTTGEEVYCVQGRDYHRSPSNLLVSTLGDWLKEADPAAKVFAASAKDRAAILIGGHDADAALWYDSGEWATSGYYAEPDWLEDFNDRRWPDAYFGRLWEPLPVPPDVLAELDIVEMDEGIYQRSFPYAFGGKSLEPGAGFYAALLSSPFVDNYLLELAKTILAEERLGTDDHPDFLGLGFSALDYVGHSFGPNSREVLDTVLRLDRTLAELLDVIDAQVGLDNTLIALSADHGVAPLPAYRRAQGAWAARADAGDVACFQDVGRRLKERFGDSEWFLFDLYLNDEVIVESGVDRAELEREITTMLGECAAVERVWTRAELLRDPGVATAGAVAEEALANSDESHYRRLFSNSFHPDRSPDFEVQYRAFYLDRRSAGTTHGSPHAYDTWVPFVIAVPGGTPGTIADHVITADLAPTLAGIMGIPTPADLDGVDRSERLGGW